MAWIFEKCSVIVPGRNFQHIHKFLANVVDQRNILVILGVEVYSWGILQNFLEKPCKCSQSIWVNGNFPMQFHAILEGFPHETTLNVRSAEVVGVCSNCMAINLWTCHLRQAGLSSKQSHS